MQHKVAETVAPIRHLTELFRRTCCAGNDLRTVTFSNPSSDRRMSHDQTVRVAKWAGHFLRSERTDSNWSLTGKTKLTNNNYLTSRPRTTILGGFPPAVTLPEDLVAL